MRDDEQGTLPMEDAIKQPLDLTASSFTYIPKPGGYELRAWVYDETMKPELMMTTDLMRRRGRVHLHIIDLEVKKFLDKMAEKEATMAAQVEAEVDQDVEMRTAALREALERAHETITMQQKEIDSLRGNPAKTEAATDEPHGMPAPASDEEHTAALADNALFDLIHAFPGAAERWAGSRKQGLSDADLLQAICLEVDGDYVHPAGNGDLVERVRAILNIPYPTEDADEGEPVTPIAEGEGDEGAPPFTAEVPACMTGIGDPSLFDSVAVGDWVKINSAKGKPHQVTNKNETERSVYITHKGTVFADDLNWNWSRCDAPEETE